MRFVSPRTALLLSFFAFSVPGRAVTMDWDGASWTAGSFNNAYDIDPTNAGNDITFTVSGDTAQLIPDSAAPMAATPSLVTSLDGGMAVPEHTLLLHLNLTDQAQAVM